MAIGKGLDGKLDLDIAEVVEIQDALNTSDSDAARSFSKLLDRSIELAEASEKPHNWIEICVYGVSGTFENRAG